MSRITLRPAPLAPGKAVRLASLALGQPLQLPPRVRLEPARTTACVRATIGHATTHQGRPRARWRARRPMQRPFSELVRGRVRTGAPRLPDAGQTRPVGRSRQAWAAAWAGCVRAQRWSPGRASALRATPMRRRDGRESREASVSPTGRATDQAGAAPSEAGQRAHRRDRWCSRAGAILPSRPRQHDAPDAEVRHQIAAVFEPPATLHRTRHRKARTHPNPGVESRQHRSWLPRRRS